MPQRDHHPALMAHMPSAIVHARSSTCTNKLHVRRQPPRPGRAGTTSTAAAVDDGDAGPPHPARHGCTCQLSFFKRASARARSTAPRVEMDHRAVPWRRGPRVSGRRTNRGAAVTEASCDRKTSPRTELAFRRRKESESELLDGAPVGWPPSHPSCRDRDRPVGAQEHLAFRP